jgi:hypothetical protein
MLTPGRWPTLMVQCGIARLAENRLSTYGQNGSFGYASCTPSETNRAPQGPIVCIA